MVYNRLEGDEGRRVWLGCPHGLLRPNYTDIFCPEAPGKEGMRIGLLRETARFLAAGGRPSAARPCEDCLVATRKTVASRVVEKALVMQALDEGGKHNCLIEGAWMKEFTKKLLADADGDKFTRSVFFAAPPVTNLPNSSGSLRLLAAAMGGEGVELWRSGAEKEGVVLVPRTLLDLVFSIYGSGDFVTIESGQLTCNRVHISSTLRPSCPMTGLRGLLETATPTAIERLLPQLLLTNEKMNWLILLRLEAGYKPLAFDSSTLRTPALLDKMKKELIRLFGTRDFDHIKFDPVKEILALPVVQEITSRPLDLGKSPKSEVSRFASISQCSEDSPCSRTESPPPPRVSHNAQDILTRIELSHKGEKPDPSEFYSSIVPIESSTPQQLNASTAQQLNTSTVQPLNLPAPQPINPFGSAGPVDKLDGSFDGAPKFENSDIQKSPLIEGTPILVHRSPIDLGSPADNRRTTNYVLAPPSNSIARSLYDEVEDISVNSNTPRRSIEENDREDPLPDPRVVKKRSRFQVMNHRFLEQSPDNNESPISSPESEKKTPFRKPEPKNSTAIVQPISLPATALGLDLPTPQPLNAASSDQPFVSKEKEENTIDLNANSSSDSGCFLLIIKKDKPKPPPVQLINLASDKVPVSKPPDFKTSQPFVDTQLFASGSIAERDDEDSDSEETLDLLAKKSVEPDKVLTKSEFLEVDPSETNISCENPLSYRESHVVRSTKTLGDTQSSSFCLSNSYNSLQKLAEKNLDRIFAFESEILASQNCSPSETVDPVPLFQPFNYVSTLFEARKSKDIEEFDDEFFRKIAGRHLISAYEDAVLEHFLLCDE